MTHSVLIDLLLPCDPKLLIVSFLYNEEGLKKNSLLEIGVHPIVPSPDASQSTLAAAQPPHPRQTHPIIHTDIMHT